MPDYPIDFPTGGAPLLNGSAWLAALGVAGVCLTLGALALGRLHRGRWGERWLLRAAAGVPLAAVAVLVAGQAPGLLFRLPWWAAALAGWGFFIYSTARRMRQGDALPRAPRTLDGYLTAAGWLLVVGWLAALLPLAVAPPINYDVLEYHLGIVPHVFREGRIAPIPHIFYTAQPIATEMLYTLAAALEGRPRGYAPGLTLWLMFVLGAGLAAAALRRLAAPSVWRPWLVLALLTHPIVRKLPLDCLTDFTGVTMLAAGLLALRAMRPRASRSGWMTWGAIIGLFAAGAVTAKWTGAGTVALPLAVMAGATLWGLRRHAPPTPALIGLGTAGLAVGLPWAAWLAMHAGNPFAPFMAGLFPTEVWTAAHQDFLMGTHGPLSPLGAAYWGNLIERLAWRTEGLPPILLALLAWAGSGALGQRRARGMRAGGWLFLGMALGIVASLLLWGQLRHAADRFLAPTILLAGLLLTGMAMQWLRGVRLRRLALLPIAGYAALGLPLIPALYQQLPLMAHATGRIDAHAYWRTVWEPTAAIAPMTAALGPETRLLAINEARRFLIMTPGGVALASVFDTQPIDPAVRGATSGEAIQQRLIEAGYTHLLFNEYEQNRLLRMHPPPQLEGDATLERALEAEDPRPLTLGYRGYVEFARRPLAPEELRAYRELIAMLRMRATGSTGGMPAVWLAPLQP